MKHIEESIKSTEQYKFPQAGHINVSPILSTFYLYLSFLLLLLYFQHKCCLCEIALVIALPLQNLK